MGLRSHPAGLSHSSHCLQGGHHHLPPCPLHSPLQSTLGPLLSPDAAAHSPPHPAPIQGSRLLLSFPTGPNLGPGQGGPCTVPPCLGMVPQEGAGSLMGIRGSPDSIGTWGAGSPSEPSEVVQGSWECQMPLPPLP